MAILDYVRGRPQFTNGWALSIGVANYTGATTLPELALNDARKVAELLQSPNCGYPKSHVKLLLDKQATRANILGGVDWLAKKAPEDATVVIFFSGHGGRLLIDGQERSTVLPVDYRGYDPKATAIGADELAERLNTIRAARTLVILDSCFAGGIGWKADDEPAEGFKSGFSPAAYQRLAQGEGRVILAASGATEKALYGRSPEYSDFSTCVIEALLGYGSQPTDELIQVFDITSYVSRRISQLNKRQHPVVHSQSENFPIALCNAGKGQPQELPPSLETLPSHEETMPHQDDHDAPASIFNQQGQQVHTQYNVAGDLLINPGRLEEQASEADQPEERFTASVVHLDLVGYGVLARDLEGQLGSDAVMRLNEQIQGFVDQGLGAIDQDRAKVVHGTAGDSALLLLATPTLAHTFAAAVHEATADHNQDRKSPTQRHFRIGIATGEVTRNGSEIAGITIANAVRLEAAASPDGVLIDEDTYDALSTSLQPLYQGPEQVKGKRQESFAAWRFGTGPANPNLLRNITEYLHDLPQKRPRLHEQLRQAVNAELEGHYFADSQELEWTRLVSDVCEVQEALYRWLDHRGTQTGLVSGWDEFLTHLVVLSAANPDWLPEARKQAAGGVVEGAEVSQALVAAVLVAGIFDVAVRLEGGVPADQIRVERHRGSRGFDVETRYAQLEEFLRTEFYRDDLDPGSVRLRDDQVQQLLRNSRAIGETPFTILKAGDPLTDEIAQRLGGLLTVFVDTPEADDILGESLRIARITRKLIRKLKEGDSV